MYWQISFILGVLFIFLIGYLSLIRFKLKSDIFLFSISFGTFFIVFLIFSLNQYLKIKISSPMIWGATIIPLSLLVLVNHKYLIKKISSAKIKFKLNFDALAVLLIVIFLFAFYKAIFFPVTADDAVLMYAFISEKAWNEGFPPEASSSYMEISYAYPNTNFVLFLNNYFFGLNFGFDEVFIKLLIPLFALLNILLLYRLSLFLFKNKEIARLATAIFVGSIIFASGIIQEYTTMYELLFPMIAIYSFAVYYESKNYKYLILSGVFFASTLMVKYTLLPFVLFFLASLILLERRYKTVLKLLLIMLPISLIFYLRNIIFYKNPFFPFFFKGANYDSELFKIQNMFANVPSYNPEQFLVALIPISFFVFIFFASFLFGYTRENKGKNIVKVLALTAILYSVFWFFTSAFIKETQGMRHLIQPFALISIFAAAFLYQKYEKKSISLWHALTPLVSIFLIYIAYFFFAPDPYFEYSKGLLILLIIQPVLVSGILLLINLKVSSKKIFALLVISFMILPIGFTAFAKRTAPWEYPSKEEVIQKYYPDHYGVFQYINKNLPADAKILSLYNQRYYIKREILPADSPKVSFLYENISLDRAVDKLKSMNVGYVMISEMEKNLPFWQISVVHLAHEERNLKLTVLYKNDEVTLYEIS